MQLHPHIACLYAPRGSYAGRRLAVDRWGKDRRQITPSLSPSFEAGLDSEDLVREPLRHRYHSYRELATLLHCSSVIYIYICVCYGKDVQGQPYFNTSTFSGLASYPLSANSSEEDRFETDEHRQTSFRVKFNPLTSAHSTTGHYHI
jgi:hypothetical protein